MHTQPPDSLQPFMDLAQQLREASVSRDYATLGRLLSDNLQPDAVDVLIYIRTSLGTLTLIGNWRLLGFLETDISADGFVQGTKPRGNGPGASVSVPVNLKKLRHQRLNKWSFTTFLGISKGNYDRGKERRNEESNRIEYLANVDR